MNAIPLVKSAFMDPFVLALEQIGCSSDYYLRRVNLPTQALDDPESLLPEIPFWQLVNQVAIEQGVPNFGMLAAQAIPWHKIESLAPLIANSLNLKDLLATFCKVASSQSSIVEFFLREEGDECWFVYSGTPLISHDTQMELYRITSMIQFVQLAAGSGWYPTQVHLLMKKSRAIETCEVLRQSQVFFSQRHCEIAIPRHLLNLPVNTEMPNSVEAANHKKHEVSSNFVGSLRQSIMAYLREEQCNIGLMADLIGVSVRTLQREIAKSGLSYTTVVDQARYIRAETLLEDPKMKLIDVAYQLGYSDPAHFTRAFKRWAGVSPREYRRQVCIPT